MSSSEDLQKSAYRITWISVILNTVLAAGKAVTGLVAQSTALLADALHSMTDIVTDVLVLVGLRVGRKGEDDSHPYGHYRFNTIAEFCVGLLLTLFAAGIFVDALAKIIQGDSQTPATFALWVAVFGLIAKEVLFWFTRMVAKKTRSRLLMANAWHHRTDSLSSLLVVIALGAAWLGGPEWAVADKIAGMGLASFLFVQGLRVILQSGNDLLDGNPGHEILDDLREHVLPIEGVVAYHKFRARRVGDFMEVDLHIQVEARLSIVEAHIIGRKVREQIILAHPEVVDVLVHIEPANRETLVSKGVSGFDQRNPKGTNLG